MLGCLNDHATDVVFGAYLISKGKSLQGAKRKFEVDIGTRQHSEDSLLDGTTGSSVAGGASASAGGASASTGTTSWW